MLTDRVAAQLKRLLSYQAQQVNKDKENVSCASALHYQESVVLTVWKGLQTVLYRSRLMLRVK